MILIRVALVDDHRVVRRGLRSFLEAFPDLQIVGEASSGEEALTRLAEWAPDVVVVDLRMPGGLDGTVVTQRIRAQAPHTQVVMLTAHSGDAEVAAALRAGALGYVRKDADPEILLAALRAAARGVRVLDPAVAHLVAAAPESAPALHAALTPRELEVLRALAHGASNRTIAERLVVGEETVKTHVANVLAKLRLAHRTQVVVYALRHGLVALEELEG